ncbi:MAG: FkbM family methyltransferase [Pyrinomonadaceae bacterium]
MIDTYNGVLACDNKDWLIGKYLYVYRTYEAETISASIDLLVREGYLEKARSGLVLDVGANIGMICIGLLKHDYFTRAIAFEPDPNCFRLLKKNVALNGMEDRIECFPYALSSTDREAELELSPENSGDNNLRYSSDYHAFREDRRQTVQVPVQTLDRFFAEHLNPQIERPSLIWLDIQGHEGHFFLGATQLLRQGIPVISEFWPYGIKRSGMSLSDYSRIVNEQFTHFYHFRDGQFEKMEIGQIDELYKIYENPREFSQLIYVKQPKNI